MNACKYERMYVRACSDSAFDSIAKEYGASSPAEINLIKTEVSKRDSSTYGKTNIYGIFLIKEMSQSLFSVLFYNNFIH